MSEYIKLSTLEFPLHEGDIRLEYPEIREDQTGDNFPCPDTYAKVEYVPFPDFDYTKQIAELDQPIQIDGVWTMRWKLRDLTQEEIDAIELAKFNSLPENLRKKGVKPNAI
jgi:hypothetical protein